MKNQLLKLLILCVLSVFASAPSIAGGIEDLNCSLNSLLGGNCSEIQEINEFQEKQQQAWMQGLMTATAMMNSIINFHRSKTPIDSYNRELYMYNLQVAKVCDEGKIDKQQALYLMTKKENELGERQAAKQPPIRRPLTCTSETFGGQTTTKCN